MSIKYLKLKIDNEDLDVDSESEFPIVFDYQLEDTQDFQKKKSSESIDMKLPATLKNQRILNTFQNTAVEDLTPNKIYKNIRNIVAEANGQEIFVGKAIPKRTIKRGGVPTSYELNCFGNNADWIITLKETTLFELLKHITLVFDKDTIQDSWNFDGRDKNKPYVFAPVKYAGWLDPDDLIVDTTNPENNRTGSDKNYSIKTMKPSLSVYWILYWGFKSAGYKIKSDFFDTDFFRRMTKPWTYGAFLSSEGTKYEIHNFLAKSVEEIWFPQSLGLFGGSGPDGAYRDLNVLDTESGCFDNNNTIVPTGDYYGTTEHGGGTDMNWKYNTPDYGPLEVAFNLALFYDYKIDLSSRVKLRVDWFKNGVLAEEVEIFNHQAPTFGSTQGADLRNVPFNATVELDDIITCKVWLYVRKSKTGTVARCKLKVEEFKIDYFRVPIGGTVNFDSYLTLQKNKFLDYLRGVADIFNLSFQTDPVNKVVLIEPTHDYSLDDDLADKQEGYFTKNVEYFTEIEDTSQNSVVELYDDNAREFVFKFRDDNNDGALKLVQDRYKITLASGKYVFSERFKAEKKEFENRYFSPTMHYLMEDFSGVTGITPQMICIVPENISNTSSSESQNTFTPKLAYYKGLVEGVGGWRFKWKDVDDTEFTIDELTDYPYLFAVNYKPGGQNDPILSYTDEKIGDTGSFVLGKGLIKRFFWQRLAIMNNGQWLNTQFKLNNKHITNWFHRERIDINGELWELLTIKSYNCLDDKSTKCVLRKWVPISKVQLDNTYPSETSVLTDAVAVIIPPPGSDPNVIDKVFDTQYNRLMCLYNDIPKPETTV